VPHQLLDLNRFLEFSATDLASGRDVRPPTSSVTASFAWFDGNRVRRTSSIVDLETTIPPFGGHRWWARCPGCDRRVLKLYAPSGLVGCRVCLDLVHPSTRENRFARACRKAQTVRIRYGFTPCLSVPWLVKPKGMHWATFARLRARDDAWHLRAAALLDAQLERMDARFDARDR
jgi:hypothetical protein